MLVIQILLVLLGLAVTYRGVRALLVMKADRMIEEFEDAFPGKCGICAYHDFGIRQGLEKHGTEPDTHRCSEGRQRWRMR